MTKYVVDTAAGKSLSAWIIMRGKKQVGKVQAHFGNSRVTVNVWDFTKEESFQSSSASGYGYDKLTSALSGLTVGGIRLSDHCGEQLKKTAHNSVTGLTFGHDAENGYKERRETTVFREDFKRKGYTAANWVGNTKRVYNRDFDESKPSSRKNPQYIELKIEGGVRGYNNMHRIAGLDILKEYGLTVIQAI